MFKNSKEIKKKLLPKFFIHKLLMLAYKIKIHQNALKKLKINYLMNFSNRVIRIIFPQIIKII